MACVGKEESVKVNKTLWIHRALADALDEQVAVLEEVTEDKIETGEVGTAALLMFLDSTQPAQIRAVMKAKTYNLKLKAEQLEQAAVEEEAEAAMGPPAKSDDEAPGIVLDIPPRKADGTGR